MNFIKENYKKYLSALRPWIGLLLGVFAVFIRYITPPQYIEAFYSRHIYIWVRGLFDVTLAFVPFPLLLVFYVVVIYFVLKIVFLLFSKKLPLKQRFTEGGRTLHFGFEMEWAFVSRTFDKKCRRFAVGYVRPIAQ